MKNECCPSLLQAPIDEATAAGLAERFAALADPVRLRLLTLIAARPDREACACELVDILDRSQPTISHHLKVLHAAGLLQRERRGTWIHYRVKVDALEPLQAFLQNPEQPPEQSMVKP